jgi:uncharacterized membrane protein YraQ (UPF0718 family)
MAGTQETAAESGVPDAYSFAYLRWRTFHDMAVLWNLLVFGFTAFLLCLTAAFIAALAVGAHVGAAIAAAGGVADLAIVGFAVKRRSEASKEEEKASQAVYANAPKQETSGSTGSAEASDETAHASAWDSARTRSWGEARARGWEPSHPSGW